MLSTESPPAESWGQALAQARAQQRRDHGTISRELLLSLAQLRGIEAGQTHAFHAQNFYLRAVQKYADHLNVTLDPPVSNFQEATLSGTHHPKSMHRASGIARRQSSPPNALHMPSAGAHGARLGRWMVLLVLGLVAAGVYLAVGEGWPSRSIDEITPQNGVNLSDPTADRVATTPATPAAVPMASTVTSATDSTFATAEPVQQLTTQTAPPASTPTDVPPNTQSQSVQGTTIAPVKAQTGATASEPPAASSPAVTSVIPGRVVTDELVLTFNQECWVELLQTNGQSQQRIYKPGEELRIAADQVERLVLGNAQAIGAQRAGKPFDVTQFIRGSGSVARLDAQSLSRTAP